MEASALLSWVRFVAAPNLRRFEDQFKGAGEESQSTAVSRQAAKDAEGTLILYIRQGEGMLAEPDTDNKVQLTAPQ